MPYVNLFLGVLRTATEGLYSQTTIVFIKQVIAFSISTLEGSGARKKLPTDSLLKSSF